VGAKGEGIYRVGGAVMGRAIAYGF
jgi:hypothetical protein